MFSPVCSSLVLKVASRCNLNCAYCYMYNVGDNTFQQQPKVMSRETVRSICKAVNDHCKKNRLKKFEFIFHGGEPLLAGQLFFRNFIRCSEEVISARVKLYYSLQTNGVLMNDEWSELLSSLRISVGISLDGEQETNDQYRKDHKGRGTYQKVIEGIETAKKYTFLKNNLGILTVINVSSDPVAVYENFKQLDIHNFNLLLPYGTYNFPPAKIKPMHAGIFTPYADWLIGIFDLWFEDEHRPEIRLFTSVIELLLGMNNEFEYFGKAKIEYLVIETDGSIEPSGALKVCGNGFTKSGLNITQHSLDEALEMPLIKLYHLSHFLLPAKCIFCPLKEICGGGHLPTRFSRKDAFNNPSVYCLDYMKLITHIQNRLWDILPASVTGKMSRISFSDMLSFHSEYHQLSKVYGN